MTFQNSILAGLTLIREAIQSQNYSPGVEGWQIAADGTAEFSDLTIRSSDGSGSTIIISNGAIKVLNGAGNTVVELDSSGYRLYTEFGDLVAQIALDSGGALGGFYTRNFAFPNNIYAFLSGGQITSGPVINSAAAIHGFLQYVMTDTAVNPYAVQTLSTGAIDLSLDDEARIQLISERGQRPVAWVDGGSSLVAADLRVTGNVRAANLQSDTLSVSFISLSSTTIPVVFPTAYPAGVVPEVMTNINSGAGATSRWGSRAISVSNTGFTLFLFRGDATDPVATWSNVACQWFAHA